MNKKIALTLIVLIMGMMGVVVAHSTIDEVEDHEYGLDWNYQHMIEHHGSFRQWFEDHDGADWYGHHMGGNQTVHHGCH